MIAELDRRTTRHAHLAERNAEIERLAVEERLPFIEIGKRYGVSRERVRQILEKRDIDTATLTRERLQATSKKYNRHCKTCGAPYRKGEGKDHWLKVHPAGTNYGTRVSDEENARRLQIAAAYLAGDLTEDIEERFGISPTMITHALHQFGFKRNRRNSRRAKTMAESDARRDAIIADIESGEGTGAEIAARHGVSPSMVYLIAKDEGLSMMTRSEAAYRRYSK